MKLCFLSFALCAIFISCGCSDRSKLEEAHKYHHAGQFKQSFDTLMPLAQKGNSEAQMEIGGMFYEGKGVDKNFEKAFEWFSRAAGQDSAEAQYNIGQMYYYGEGTVRDERQASLWLKKAIRQGGLPEAEINLAACYCLGTGVGKDFKKAAVLLADASRQGSPIAQARLATLYYEGKGVEKNYKIAFEYFQKAANQNLVEAQRALMKMYLEEKGITVVKDTKPTPIEISDVNSSNIALPDNFLKRVPFHESANKSQNYWEMLNVYEVVFIAGGIALLATIIMVCVKPSQHWLGIPMKRRARAIFLGIVALTWFFVFVLAISYGEYDIAIFGFAVVIVAFMGIGLSLIIEKIEKMEDLLLMHHPKTQPVEMTESDSSK